MNENMKKWPQTETGSQTSAFTLLNEKKNHEKDNFFLPHN